MKEKKEKQKISELNAEARAKHSKVKTSSSPSHDENENHDDEDDDDDDKDSFDDASDSILEKSDPKNNNGALARGLPLPASKNPPASLLEHQLQQQQQQQHQQQQQQQQHAKSEGLVNENLDHKLPGSASLIGGGNDAGMSSSTNEMAALGGGVLSNGVNALNLHEVNLKSSSDNGGQAVFANS